MGSGRGIPWRRKEHASLLLIGIMQATIWLCLASADQLLVRTVRTGQELADAVAEWGLTGSNMTIQFGVPFISLRNASIANSSSIQAANPAVTPFSRGSLVIDGQNGTLDAGMRDSLIPSLLPTAQEIRYEVKDMAIINACEGALDQLPFNTPGASNPFQLLLFRGTWLYLARFLTNVVVYGRQAAVASITYQFALQRSRLPEIRTAIAAFLETSGVAVEAGSEFSPYSQSVQFLNESSSFYRNFTARSISNPNDQFIQRYQAEGVLLPAQICSGGVLPGSFTEARRDPLLAPVWFVNDQATFAAALQEATAQTKTPSILGMPVMVWVGNMDAVDFPANGPHEVFSGLMLMSNVPLDAPFEQLLVVNLKQREAVFNITGKGRLLIEHMALTGLAAKVPTQLPASLAALPTSSLQPSVFPLAAFTTSNSPDTWANSSQVLLFNVTLSIPPNEYLAFLVLASRQSGPGQAAGCVDASTLRLADQLQAGVSKLQVGPAPTADQASSLIIDSFVGWGTNAPLLRLVPSSPVVLPACWSGSSGSNAGSSKRIAIGLAVGLGGSACLVAAILLVVWWRRQHAAEASSSPASSRVDVRNNLSLAAPANVFDSDGVLASSLTKVVSVPSSASPGQSLCSGVHEAALRQQQLLDSVLDQRSAPVDGGSPAAADDILVNSQQRQAGKTSRALRALDPSQMHGQIQDLAKALHHGTDRLVLTGVLGAGSGGTVYMGIWKGMNVAVKTAIFCEGHSGDAPRSGHYDLTQHRAVMETAIAVSVGHRNLVATYHYDIKPLVPRNDAAAHGGLQIDMTSGSKRAEQNAYKLFLVQELCNMSLGDALSGGLLLHPGTNQLDLGPALILLLDIASGLAYLHSKNIIHGDLKPDNVLLKVDDTAPESVIAKLTDFGLSTRMDPGATHVSGYHSGTPFYVAPEVVSDHQTSPASDMFSFGVVMWEVFTQQTPFQQTPQRHYVANPLFPNYPRNCTPPVEYAQLSRGCLKPSPHDRPSAQVAAQVLSSLVQAYKSKLSFWRTQTSTNNL